jgi:hypothetical protein
MRYDNSEAAGAVISLVAVFLLSSILFIIIGYGVDRVIMTSIAMQSMPSSQMRYDVIRIMIMTFRFEPIVILVGSGLNAWVVSTRTLSGEIDLGGMLLGASEMILLTLVMIALTMFGGLGIEFVINMVTHSTILGTGELALFQAVQYIAPVFYGLCFLGLVGAVIQFILQCVQVVDYSNLA